MNEEKFVGKAEVYAEFRPTYPEEFIEYLYATVGFSDSSTVADIGAGTGIFSKLLALKNTSLICVEPNTEMLNEARKTLGQFAKIKLIKASAENTTLHDNSVDFITVAQAFHWFEREKFKAECQRILKNNGKVVLVWNCRDNTNPVVIENAETNKRLCPDFKGFTSGLDENPQSYADFFKNGKCEYKTFISELKFDEERFIGRCLSGSYAPIKNSENYYAYIKEIKKLFNKYSKNKILSLPNITRSYVGEV